MPLLLYNFFHLNLAYSAIEEEDRARVIERCYWPLLRLARRRNLPFSIELSGYTLEAIQALDPSWVEELASLVQNGPCELIGCGYAQVVGPLVPHEVTSANLRVGHAVYEQILGVRPRIALLNEQAFSSGLVPLYKEACYEAIIMEWNNPAREHPEWSTEWRYLPQRAMGTGQTEISLIWNKSIAFQKFQRYAHGELELDELLAYVRSHQCSQVRAFPLYGNDVEIFDYRPGRYMTEAMIHDEGEWLRIDRLYEALEREPHIRFIKTSDVLSLNNLVGANHLLQLTSAAQPIPVKKQDKYNVVRWAVTGRDDLEINTRCWRLYETLKVSPSAADSDWKELCYLWSSDFRTHITEKRWRAYLTRLSDFEKKFDVASPSYNSFQKSKTSHSLAHSRHGRYLDIEGKNLSLRLNCKRGLAIESFIDRAVSDSALFGTLHHGYFDDIRWGADYYSGHLVFESPGSHKVTDLVPVEPSVKETGAGLEISCAISTRLGPIEKTLLIDDEGQKLTLRYVIDWKDPIVGSLRLGYVTLIPGALNSEQLRYYACNGGREPEVFNLQSTFYHGTALSFLISAAQAIPLTTGRIEISDDRSLIIASIKKEQKALVGMVMNQLVDRKPFTRFHFSALEHDDTSRPTVLGHFHVEIDYGVRLKRSPPPLTRESEN
jgi:hypothetical protein